MAERCELTELLVDQCACMKHRGGQTPAEQADADRRQLRARLLSQPLGEFLASWFPAQYEGRCHSCNEPFEVGHAIRRQLKPSGAVYVAECCAEEADSG